MHQSVCVGNQNTILPPCIQLPVLVTKLTSVTETDAKYIYTHTQEALEPIGIGNYGQ